MIDFSSQLTLQHFDGLAYTNYTNKLYKFSDRDTATITLDTDHYVYVGYEKPIRNIYAAFKTANVNSNEFTVEYYNGTAWIALSVLDDTLGFTRDGFISWEAPTDWESNEVNSIDKYYVRISTDTLHSATEILGINIIFSDDNELKTKYAYILDSDLLGGQSTHILIHESIRDLIIQKFRKKEYYKVVNSGTSRLVAWDVLDLEDVRSYATYKALATIFFNAHDNEDDSYYKKYEKYNDLAENSFDFNQVIIDSDNDGEIDSSEKTYSIKNKRLSR